MDTFPQKLLLTVVSYKKAIQNLQLFLASPEIKHMTVLSKEIALDRSAWRLAINVPEP